MGVFELVIVVVVIGAVCSTIQLTMKHRHESRQRLPDPQIDRLLDEMRRLKERLSVVERLAIERENSLDREIESLRGR